MQSETSYFFLLPYSDLSELLLEGDMDVLLSGNLAKRQLIRSELLKKDFAIDYWH